MDWHGAYARAKSEKLGDRDATKVANDATAAKHRISVRQVQRHLGAFKARHSEFKAILRELRRLSDISQWIDEILTPKERLQYAEGDLTMELMAIAIERWRERALAPKRTVAVKVPVGFDVYAQRPRR